MTANSLLMWMSARRHGSWAQFRASVEQLHLGMDASVEGEDDDAPDQFGLPLYHTLRFNLQRVGHAEFFAGAGEGADWRVTPPALAITPSVRGWLGIVAGARSLAMMEKLRSGVAAAAADLQTKAFPGYPDQLLITADDRRTLRAVAERAGLYLQCDAPAGLLASLPAVDDPSVCYRTQLPFGSDWKIDRFSPEDLIWSSATFNDACAESGGLFRFSLRHQRHMLLCRGGLASRVPGQVGKYLVLRRRRRQVLQYDDSNLTLSMPATCRPPFLVERALILCSGSPPLYERGRRGGLLHYADITRTIAATAAELLRQELR